MASANGCINDAARAWFSLGRDRYLPTWFSAVHPKYRTPYRSIVFLLPIALAFAFIAETRSGDHLLDPVGRAALHVHEHQHHDVPEQVAIGVRSGADIPIRFHPIPAIVLLVLCIVTFFAIFLGYGSQLTAMVVFYVLAFAVVPFLPVQVCAARRPVHHAVA